MFDNFINTCYKTSTYSSTPKRQAPILYAKGDSGASTHYVRPQDACVLSNICTQPGPPVTQPDGTTMITQGSRNLPLHRLISEKARTAQILPELCSVSLVALGLLCDDRCSVVLTEKYLVAVKTNKVILQGKRNKEDDLWDIPLQAPMGCKENYEMPQIHPNIYLPNSTKYKPPDPIQLTAANVLYNKVIYSYRTTNNNKHPIKSKTDL